MKIFKKWRLFFCFMLVGIFFYVSQNMMIYHTPRITLFSPYSLVTSHSVSDKLTCFTQQETVPALTKSTLSLLVWNLHKGSDKGWEEALYRLAQDQDIVLLQEATPRIENTPLASLFSTRLYVSSFAYKGNKSGIGVLSHFAPQTYCIGVGIEPWIRIPKLGIAMLFPVKDKPPLLIINLHLVNFELNPTYYRNQLTQLFSLLEGHQGAVIIAGDFNAWNKKRYQFVQKLSQKYGLQEVTFTPDYRSSFLSHPLDFVFIRGMHLLSARTEKTSASDHNPLILKLAFQSNDGGSSFLPKLEK